MGGSMTRFSNFSHSHMMGYKNPTRSISNILYIKFIQANKSCDQHTIKIEALTIYLLGVYNLVERYVIPQIHLVTFKYSSESHSCSTHEHTFVFIIDFHKWRCNWLAYEYNPNVTPYGLPSFSNPSILI